jgi:hypothetical protein
MLIESKRVKSWIHSAIVRQSAPRSQYGEHDANWEEPPKHISLNPMPALIIFLLGLMMGSHHQTLMVSTMMHRQWGTLLAGGALCRAVTYLLIYVKPPTSYFPARPPSELVGCFCVIAGGLLFMLSVCPLVFKCPPSARPYCLSPPPTPPFPIHPHPFARNRCFSIGGLLDIC